MKYVREFAEKFGRKPSVAELTYYLDCTQAYALKCLGE